MAKIEYKVQDFDYGNGIGLSVRVSREGGEDPPTPGDLLDTIINLVAPQIRCGMMSSHPPSQMEDDK